MQKTVIFLGDGMADEPLEELNGTTPLQYAKTPAMDSIAKDGICGTLLTLPQGYPTSSDVANMSILGCDLKSEYCGRGPLEAAGLGIPLQADDSVFRVNLCTAHDGILDDFSGGHISQSDAEALVAVLNDTYGSDAVRFHPGVSYRNILILSGSEYSHRVAMDKPDDNHAEKIADHLPRALSPEAESTASLIRKLMLEAQPVLEDTETNRKLKSSGKSMVNAVWPWSGGQAGAIKTIGEKYGVTGAVISAVAVIKGLGKCLGMDVIEVPGATGYIDTNYEGKARAAIDAIEDRDLVYVHVEAIDEVSHEMDLKLKIQAIENFDSRIVAPVLNHFGNSINTAVLPDHPVSLATGKHTRTPVPVAVNMAGREADSVKLFSEVECLTGSLGAMKSDDLMKLLLT